MMTGKQIQLIETILLILFAEKDADEASCP